LGRSIEAPWRTRHRGIAVGFFYGIFFAAIRRRAGGIVGLIIVHGLMNLSTIAMVPNVDLNFLMTQVQVVNSWLAILSEIIFLGLLSYLWKAPRRQIHV
jgi:membrane protease YdiL (CAAX protease family)